MRAVLASWVRERTTKNDTRTLDYSGNIELLDTLGTVKNSEGAELKGVFYSQEQGI